MRRLIAIGAASFLIAWSPPVEAGIQQEENRPNPGGIVADGRPTAVVVRHGEGGVLASWASSSGGGGGGGSSWTCRYRDLVPDDGGFAFTVDHDSTPTLENGRTYALLCTDDAGQLVYQDLVAWDPTDPLAGVAADQRAAEAALADLDLPGPAIATSPAPGTEHLVGLPTWLWLEDWSPRSASAALAGVSATVTVEPTAVRWDTGDGATVTCDGPGTPWQPGAAGGCTHTWSRRSTDQPAGAFPLTATVSWSASWSASTGAGGDLGTLTSTSTVDVVVVEAQAVVRR